jgi:very-short-patch-repair endonuclease
VPEEEEKGATGVHVVEARYGAPMPDRRPYPDAERLVSRLASRQHGVVTRRQMLALGLGRRVLEARVRRGIWIRVHPAVYRAASAPPSWHSDLLAALLWAGPDAMASHRAAARLWRLAGVDDAPVELLATRSSGRPGIIVHRRGPRELPRRRRPDGIPATDVGRTILDLGAVWPTTRVGVALDDALQRRLVSVRGLRRLLDREGGRGRRGTTVLRKLLVARDGLDARVESELERRLLRVLRRARLPVPEAQHEVRHRGRLVARLDFAYPSLRVGIETHGFRWHGGRERWQRDIRRDNRLKRMGWTVLVYTWEDVVDRPRRVVEELEAILGSPVLFPTLASDGG